MATPDERAAVIAGLRALADRLEADPLLPTPAWSTTHLLLDEVEDLEKLAQELDLPLEFDDAGQKVTLTLPFGAAVRYKLFAYDFSTIATARAERGKVEKYAAAHGLVLVDAPLPDGSEAVS